ncbi:MAG: NADH-quinone oxidoreductase subunit M, partial [Actinobacteria bacterium]|nr:NADH-quinone oxidoreductase subunit M [Actinomycetota bacterium]
MLSAAIFVPLLGSVALLVARRLSERRARVVALAVAAVPLVILTVAWLAFDGGGDGTGAGGFELVESVPWIPTLGVGYKVGVDGLSLPLAAMTALLFLASIAYPADLRGRPRQYFAAFLFLEAASLG